MENAKLDKYLGALLGAVIGDSLGWPNEQNSNRVNKDNDITDNKSFQVWSRKCGGGFWAHNEIIKKGEYSDDTQLIIATLRSLCNQKNWLNYYYKIELPAWISYERGGGGATKRSAEIWKKGIKPWNIDVISIDKVKRYFQAGGNGVAMRILPHVYGNEDNQEKIMRQVVLNGVCTHGHPRALIGAMLYAEALRYISNNKSLLQYGEVINYLIEKKEMWSKFPELNNLDEWIKSANIVTENSYFDTWNEVVEETIKLLKIVQKGLELGALDTGNGILENLGCFDKRINGSGTITAVASVYMFSKYASNPELGVIEASHLKNADTDTLASMVGALQGMLHGTSWILAEWYEVQDYEFLRKLLYSMLEKNKIEKSEKKLEILDVSKQSLKQELKKCKIGDIFNKLPFNQLTVIDIIDNNNIISGIKVKTIKLRSDEGQTIFIKTFEKEKTHKTLSKIDDRDKSNKKNSLLKEQEVSKMSNDNNNLNYKTTRIFITPNKLRSFANLQPENMPTDQYLFLISDIMMELERSKINGLEQASLSLLKNRWRKYNVEDKHINNIVKVLLVY